MLTGYLSKLSCRAGETVDVMVSSSSPDVTIDVIRLIHGDTNPLGPGFVFDEIAEIAPQTVSAREMATPIGSFAVSAAPLAMESGKGLDIRMAIWPTVPALGRRQTLLGLPGMGLSLCLDQAGCLTLLRAGDVVCRIERPFSRRTWYALSVSISSASTAISVDILRKAGAVRSAFASQTGGGWPLGGSSDIFLAASHCREEGEQRFPIDVYNGKIACPSLSSGSLAIAKWAFEQDMDLQVCRDIIGGNDLRLVNVPTRAMTGPAWNGLVHAWTLDPSQYDAIHFHDDDLSDAGWPVSAQVSIPESLRSGVYAVRLRTADAEDHIPLAVRPGPNAAPSPIAFVLGTYTYVAYANEHLTEGEFEQGSELEVKTGEAETLAAAHQEWGKSVYDYHSDGSGVAHSTHLRPIPNMRPTYQFWGFDAPRRFSCDLYIVNFLHQRCLPFDIITEHDLDAEWETILDPYQTVIASSHPEYYSGQMLDAYERHAETGGGLLYLGGDGFYWVTTAVRDLPHVIEVRKFEGLRHWEAGPGERYHSSTGELGGIWRSRGRSAHAIFGVGMAGYGWDRKAPGYRRTTASYEPEASWVFDGIEDEVIGDFGLIMNGTSGDEIDRIDYHYGTPPETIVLASSEPHSEWYVPVPEDILSTSNKMNAAYNPNVRSDMVLIEKDGGGAVFSVGSIIFAGALPVNGGKNNVATLLENVVRNFTARKRTV
ncbi:large subunit of N,N-dimethylformamidase [Labrys miyagiensis]